MDVVANYATGDEAVGAFFSCEGRKGKPPVDDDEGPSRGPKKNKKKKKTPPFQLDDLDDDLVAAMERKRPRGPPAVRFFFLTAEATFAGDFSTTARSPTKPRAPT